MQIEQLKMSKDQTQTLTDILKTQGLTKSEIDEIINGEYSSFQTDIDLKRIFRSDVNYQNVLRGLADGYTIDELIQQGINPKEIDEFMQELKNNNLSIENAKAINQYSNESNMILSMKRGLKDRNQIKNEIKTDMMDKLKARALSQEQIKCIEDYIQSLDFSKPVHENYEMISQYIQQRNIPHNCYPSICTAVKDMDSLEHIDSTLSNLDEGLSKVRLSKSMKLYRAIKTDENINPESYIGKSISNKGYTSTSPLYQSSFAKYDDYDTVMEIYAPKGTQGTYITQLSDYDSEEQEVLLNPNDIYIIDAQKGVVDQNGKTKTVLKGILLSKEREGYKGIDKQQENEQTRYEQQYQDISQKQMTESNLPAKNNGFLRFFNQMRSRFSKQAQNKNTKKIGIFRKNKMNIQQYDKEQEKQQREAMQTQPKEKKSWKLEIEEKARIQRESAEIAKRHREQTKQQKQSQTLQQENNQQETNYEYGTNQTKEQVLPKQQPSMMDMEGIEL